MRAVLVVLALSTVVDAEPARWQQATSAPSIYRVWGVGAELYGVGPSGVHRSTDGGATWSPADKGGAANGVWGTGLDDLWVVRDRSIHHSVDGAGGFWTNQVMPVSMATKLEGIWGAGNERYVFGSDRSQHTAVVLRSRDRGQSWHREEIDGERVAGMWGRDANDLYAVTERGVLHATGDGWSLVARGSLEAIGGDAKAIYAVGANGTIVSSTDGKAWTRRASGVTYALSSIMAANGEIFVGSVDGPPLRSTDGIAWKPMTGMVPKGHVWSGTLAAAGDVYALTTPAPTPVFIPSVTPSPNTKIHEQMTNREALAARLDVEKDSKLPFRRDLIRIATTRFEDGFPMLPRLARAGTPISLDVTSKTGCGSEPLPPQRPNAKFSGTLTCTMTCSEVSATLKLANTTSGAKLTSRIPITSCSLQAAAVKDLIEVMEIRLTNSHLDGLKQRIAKLKPGTDERLDTLAAYVLDGGPDPTYRTLLAAELGVSSQWPGLFWNRAPSTTRIPTACKANQMIVRDAEESTRSGLHRDALDTYELLTDCEPSYSVDAYRAACRARNPQRAAFHFANMAGRFQLKYLPECTDAGIDPRRPPTNP